MTTQSREENPRPRKPRDLGTRQGNPQYEAALKGRCLNVCVRTSFQASGRDETPENPAPEGRTSLAQRDSAGKSGKKDSSPRGTTEFSRTHFYEDRG